MQTALEQSSRIVDYNTHAAQVNRTFTCLILLLHSFAKPSHPTGSEFGTRSSNPLCRLFELALSTQYSPPPDAATHGIVTQSITRLIDCVTRRAGRAGGGPGLGLRLDGGADHRRLHEG
jgi:hypothetical protein